MAERIRDTISKPVTLDYFQERRNQGWVLTAVEWVKPGAEASNVTPDCIEVPYGQRVAEDCGHLADDLHEMQVLMQIYEKVVSGWRPPEIASDLNMRGLRTRAGGNWTAATVFDLLPRLVELSPRLLKRPDWVERRSKLQVIA